MQVYYLHTVGHVRMSRSSNQGQGHSSKNWIYKHNQMYIFADCPPSVKKQSCSLTCSSDVFDVPFSARFLKATLHREPPAFQPINTHTVALYRYCIVINFQVHRRISFLLAYTCNQDCHIRLRACQIGLYQTPKDNFLQQLDQVL